MQNVRQHGFTLIELSIVLVIIGLLVGGVLVGRDLITAAQMRKLESQADSYKTAVNAFNLKYNCYPGDCATMTHFFPGSGGCPNAALDLRGTRITCNGDGNEKIDDLWSGDLVGFFEIVNFWRHLSLAGLIPGDYSGWFSCTGNCIIVGVDAPASPLSNLAFMVLSEQAAAPYSWPGSGNFLYLQKGMSNPGGFFYDNNDTLTGQQLSLFDSKYDDGKPGTGSITSNVPGRCTTTTDPTTAVYDLTVTTQTCTPAWVRIF